MKKAVIVLLLVLFAAGAFAQSWLTDDVKKDLMPVSQVKRGMKGYGLTVFQGTKIEKFNFEVRGILKEANSGGDLILVQLKHPLIDSRMSGVIQGMSGSPCYINGKLVGAVAYGGGFNKENTCMLTPIYDMMETLDPRLEEKPASAGAPRAEKSGMKIPLTVSGISDLTRNMFKDTFEKYGFAPVAGSGGRLSGMDTKGASLQPGAAVGAVLITGDINAVGTGTVTWRKGNTLLAFGHPMDEIGPTSIPMCTAYIVDVFSGYEISHKYSVPLDIVGSIYQDRPFAIAGRINGVASMTPVNTHVKDRATGREKTLRCKVASGENYFGSFAVMPVVEAYARVRPQQTDVNCRATYELELAGGEKHVFTNYYTSSSDVSGQIARELYKALESLSESKYGYQRLRSVNVDMELDSGNKYAFIERVFMNEKELKAGEDVEIGLVMRPYGSKTTFTETKTLHVPDNLEDGNLAVLIYGGAMADAVKLAPTSNQGNNILVSVTDPADNSTSFEQYFRKAMDFDKNNELVIKLVPASGDVLVVEGNRLDGMPPYMNQLFSSVNNSVFTTEKLDYKTVFTAGDYIPMGAVVMSVPVKNYAGVNIRDREGKPLSVRIIKPAKPDALFAGDPAVLRSLAGELDEAIEAVKKEQEGAAAPASAEEKKEEPKPEEKKEEPKPAENKPVTTVAKRPSVLEIKDGELAKGEFLNCSIGKDNAVLATVETLAEASVPQQMATCALPSEEGIYIGTGLKAAVYLKKEAGKPELVCGLDDLWVTRLINTPEGLFAATAPSGKVFRREGREAKEAAAFDHKYISDIARLSDGRLLVGFADSDTIYVCSPGFEKREALQHKGVYTTDFAEAPDGSIIIATKAPLLRYDGSELTTLSGGFGGSISCIAADPAGNIYAFVAGKNMIVKRDARGAEKTAERTDDCFRAICDKSGNVYFAGRSKVTRIYPDGRYATHEFRGAVNFSDIVPGKDGEAVLCSANPGSIYEIRLHPSECMYATQSIDMGSPVLVRGIEAPCLGAEWFFGSGFEDKKPAQKNASFSAGRFIARFNEGLQGTLNRIAFSYLTANRPPEVKLKNPAFGQKISGKYKLEWDASDPDGDAWVAAVLALKPGSDKPLVLYPNDKEQPKADAKPETSKEIDTSGLEDGVWRLGVMISDEPANPEGFLTATAEAEVLVCNSRPAVEAALSEDRKTLSGKASCRFPAEIAGVQYSFDGGAWFSCRPEKGVFEGTEAAFTASITIPQSAPKGERVLKVRAVDTFGNSADADIKLNIE
ncbi:MAG: hypothetical protein ILO36_07505 [Abditibacteriota bacterium]|nr:hypothetical protein [Abditibacteriota bacterium]